MMANMTRTLVLSATIAYLLVAGQVLGEGEDELKFNGNSGDNQELDTNTITDTEPSINPSNQQPDQSNNFPRPRPNLPFPRLPPSQSFGASFGGSLNGPFGSPFRGPFDSPLESLFRNPLGPLSSLFSSTNSLMNDFQGAVDNYLTNIDDEFSKLDRKAGHKEVSYFNRNGEAYVKICTVRKLSPGERDGYNQIPSPDQVNSQEQQQLQPQQQQQPAQTVPQEPPKQNAPVVETSAS